MQVQTIILILVSALGGIYDLKFRKIPNWLSLGTILVFLIFNLFNLKVNEILNCIFGFIVGMGLLFIPYLMGGMGAGDVKLLGAIGSIVGFKGVILVFLYSSISGMLMGLAWLILTPGHLKFLITTGQMLPVTDKKQKVPYGIAIFLGTILYITFGKSSFFNIYLWQ